MNIKIRNKILGVFVVIGLIIILLPFFQSSEEVPSTASLVTAPSFPDQAIQVAAPSPEQPIPAAEVPKPAAPASDSAANTIKEIPDDTIQNLHTETTIAPAVTPPAAAEPVKPEAPKKIRTHVKKVMQAKKAAPKRKFYDSVKQGPVTDDGLFALKNPAWVVQIGSFKNKANALRLVNQLRANGYRAFIQKFSTTFGDNTRVFVGPENKHDSARLLASQLETDMHLHGIVISYKPLML